jgi:hypothetical protein
MSAGSGGPVGVSEDTTEPDAVDIEKRDEGVACEGEGTSAWGVRGVASSLGGVISEVAITKKVARSKRTTSVAEHACANVVKWRDSVAALGMSVFTTRDQAYGYSINQSESNASGPVWTYFVERLVVDTCAEHLDRHTRCSDCSFLDKLGVLPFEGLLTIAALASQVHLVD